MNRKIAHLSSAGGIIFTTVLGMSGCAQAPEAKTVMPPHAHANEDKKTETITVMATNDGTAGKSYRVKIVAANEAVSDDINFPKYRAMIEYGLTMRGFAVVDAGAACDVEAQLSYEAGNTASRWQTNRQTYLVRDPQAGSGVNGASLVAAAALAFIPRNGGGDLNLHLSSDRASTTSSNYTPRSDYIAIASLTAVDSHKAKGSRPVWAVNAAISTYTPDSDETRSYLMTALAGHSGEFPGNPTVRHVRESEVDRLRLRSGPPAPIVNPIAKNDGMFACFTTCTLTIRCGEGEATGDIEKAAKSQLAGMNVTVNPKSSAGVVLTYDKKTEMLRLDIVKNKTDEVLYSVRQKDFKTDGTDMNALTEWVFVEARNNSDMDKFSL